MRVDITRYQICGLPPDDIDASVWSLTVEARGHGKWAVCHMSYCYPNNGGPREIEPLPSERDNEYLALFRFDSAEAAIEYAKAVYPKLVINGLRVENGKLVPK